MRESLHPAYPNAVVKCACGASWETRSTSGDMHLDICGNCHPFYTGKQKLMDTQGRIDRFNKRYANSPKATEKAEPVAPTPKKAADTKPAKQKKPKADGAKPKA